MWYVGRGEGDVWYVGRGRVMCAMRVKVMSGMWEGEGDVWYEGGGGDE